MRPLLWLTVLLGLFVFSVTAQQPIAVKPRVHIADRDTWQEEGGFTAAKDTAAGHYNAGVLRRNTELVKTLDKQCPGVTITANKAAAGYIVI